MKIQNTQFKYKAHMTVGAMSAEVDDQFLNTCFVETGDFDVIKDISSPKCILLGRTGVGKSAAIIHIKNNHENVIDIDPQSLAIKYIANSDILRVLSDAGVKLDIFYKLLWQHVLCVELLNNHFKMKNESDYSRFSNWLTSLGKKDKPGQIATQYLEKWNAKFWIEREERIKEITRKLEDSLVAEVGVDAPRLKGRLSVENGFSEEAKVDIVYKAQKVVNDIQIQNLSEVIDVLSRELYNDSQKKTFITIDSLDEDWVEDDLRYKLIRSLVETIKKFRRIKNVKIVVALRTDLLKRVYKMTRDAGFQEEKYEDMNLRISWNKEHLKKILDRRINQLLKKQYTNGDVDFYDIFPQKIKESPTLDFLAARSFMRPRDMIAFVNCVLERANGANEISTKMILESEKIYSEQRLSAVLQEWMVDFSGLEKALLMLRGKPTIFSLGDVSDEEADEVILALYPQNHEKKINALQALAVEQIEGKRCNYNDFKVKLMEAFFQVGIIGYKEFPSNPFLYSFLNHVNEPHFKSDTKVQIHPMFWAALGNQRLKGAVLRSVNDA